MNCTYRNEKQTKDHLPPEIRDAIDDLEDIEESDIPSAISNLDEIDVIIQTAILNSVSDSSTPSTSQKKEILTALPPKTLSKLKTKISMVSHDLDGIAANIDSVRSSGNIEVKARKKRLSSLAVSLMKRADEFVDLCSE